MGDTIGHSTRSVEELIRILHAFGVTRLVDIRSVPRSRANPQFDIDVLPRSLERARVAYTHLPALGGLRSKSKVVSEHINGGWETAPFHNVADDASTPGFQEGLRELLGRASRETCAILCTEALWWRCHRRIVADHVLAHGFRMVHLFTETKSQPASLTPFAVLGEDARVSYPAANHR